MVISEDFSEEEVEAPSVAKSHEASDRIAPLDPSKVEPVISLNAITRFYAPQNLNIIGYIENHKVIILIDSGSTHNFIHYHIS
jgi:hypothetical protein